MSDAMSAYALRSPVWRRLVGVAAIIGISLIAEHFAIAQFSPRHMSAAARVTHLVPNAPLAPALGSRTVYFTTRNGFYALRASDGALRWTYPAQMNDTTKEYSIQGYVQENITIYVLTRETTTLSNGAVQNQTTLSALKVSDGSVLWNVLIPGVLNSELAQVGPLLIVIPSGPFTIEDVPDARSITAYNSATGALVWRRTPDIIPYASATSPNGVLYVATTQALIAIDAATGAIRWTSSLPTQLGAVPTDVNVNVALSATTSHVYALTKRALFRGVNPNATVATTALLYTIDAANGRRLALSKQTYTAPIWEAAFDVAYPPTVAGSTLFTPIFDGMSASSIGPGGAHWSFSPQDSSAPVAVTNSALAYGVMYMTDITGVTDTNQQGGIDLVNFTYAVRASDGAEMWRVPVGDGGIFNEAPSVVYGLVLVPAGDTLRALRASDGSQLWEYTNPTGAF